MEPWIETYRGAVSPWETDVTEHFTVAFYFDRVAMAEATLAERLGLLDTLRAGGFVRRYDVRYARELRAGGAFHIESAAMGVDGGVRLGHRFIDSVTGECITWFDVHWDAVSTAVPADKIAENWDGPEFETRADPQDLSKLVPTAAGRIQPGDLDEFDRLGICGTVHKFTDSSVQIGAAIGLTADYIRTARRGFSTFEFRVRISGALKLGDAYQNRTGIAHLGNSSLRMVHRMTDPRSGAEVARLSQYGVNLDLDARRPARWPDDIRDKAAALLVPVG